MTSLKNSHAVYILVTPHMKFGRMCFVVDMLKMTRLAYMLINLNVKGNGCLHLLREILLHDQPLNLLSPEK